MSNVIIACFILAFVTMAVHLFLVASSEVTYPYRFYYAILDRTFGYIYLFLGSFTVGALVALMLGLLK